MVLVIAIAKVLALLLVLAAEVYIVTLVVGTETTTVKYRTPHKIPPIQFTYLGSAFDKMSHYLDQISTVAPIVVFVLCCMVSVWLTWRLLYERQHMRTISPVMLQNLPKYWERFNQQRFTANFTVQQMLHQRQFYLLVDH